MKGGNRDTDRHAWAGETMQRHEVGCQGKVGGSECESIIQEPADCCQLPGAGTGLGQIPPVLHGLRGAHPEDALISDHQPLDWEMIDRICVYFSPQLGVGAQLLQPLESDVSSSGKSSRGRLWSQALPAHFLDFGVNQLIMHPGVPGTPC